MSFPSRFFFDTFKDLMEKVFLLLTFSFEFSSLIDCVFNLCVKYLNIFCIDFLILTKTTMWFSSNFFLLNIKMSRNKKLNAELATRLIG